VWMAAGSLALSLAAAPPDWGARASIEGELSAGALSAAGAPGTAAGVETEWSPGFEVDLARYRQHLLASYHPLLALRVPAAVGGRPLVLHRLALRWDDQLEHRAELTAGAFLDVGDVYYGRSMFVFNGAAFSSSVPDVDVVSVLNFGGDSGLRWQLDRRQALHLNAAAGFTGPLADAPAEAPFPDQVRASIETGYELAAARQHALQLVLQARWVQFTPGPTYQTVSPRVDWRAQWTALWATTVRGGVLVAQRQGSLASVLVLPVALMPVAELGVDGRARLRRRLIMHLDLRAGLDGYFDPVATTLSPQGSLRSLVELALGPRAVASAEAYGYIPFEGVLGAAPPVGWRRPLLTGGEIRVSPWSSRDLSFEFGVRGFGEWAIQAGSARERRELVGFVGLRAGLDVSR